MEKANIKYTKEMIIDVIEKLKSESLFTIKKTGNQVYKIIQSNRPGVYDLYSGNWKLENTSLFFFQRYFSIIDTNKGGFATKTDVFYSEIQFAIQT